ncbi:MAG: EF-P lysine aminoacylase GenX [Hyphomicrobiaceae bacterium]|nr:EF-P lysine aminoacylase GenX [Hyphomicrobiaceae bacterium]
MSDARPFWHPDRHTDRRPLLVARGRIKNAIRRWFEDQGFQEVDTACLQVSPGNEAHLHAFKTSFDTEAGASTPLYLHTSPEFACKKLLAAGETKIFTFAPVFRNAERGRLHAPEFTMLEWYRTGAPYTQMMDDCAALLKIASGITGRTEWTWNNRTCDISKNYDWTTLFQAFAQQALPPLHVTLDDGTPNLARMRAEVAKIGVRVADDDTWSDLFSRVLAERIEPFLGLYRPEMLCEYPTHEAALARPVPDDPIVAERFEMYVCGVELANAFGELTDADQQRARFEAEMAEKERVYGRRYPLDEDFLAALATMPPASGCALGFDRLVMLATGATHIDQVQWTPVATTP